METGDNRSLNYLISVLLLLYRLLAYRAEDIEERLIPNELKRRITLEQNVQEEVNPVIINKY